MLQSNGIHLHFGDFLRKNLFFNFCFHMFVPLIKKQTIMNTIKKNIRIISVLLAISMLFVSCHQSIEEVLNDSETNSVSTEFQKRLSNEYTGEELFQSIFFGYGEFADKINMYNEIERTEEEIQKFSERFTTFAEKLKEENPNYFEIFKTIIFSDDNIEIQKNVELGYNKIYENLEILLPELLPLIESLQEDEDIITFNNQENITQENFDYLEDKYRNFLNDDYLISPNGCTWGLACVAGVALAVVVWLAVYYKKALWGPKLDKPNDRKKITFDISDSELKFELFIQDIANATHN